MENRTIYFIYYFFVMKICWHSNHNICWLICWYAICSIYNFITCNHWIVNSTFWIFTIFLTTRSRFEIWCFSHASYSFKFLHLHRRVSLFHFWFKLHFLPLHLHLHSHDICFVYIFDSFIPVIILKTLKFKCFVWNTYFI